MKTQKLYFCSKINEDFAYSKQFFLKKMKEQNLKELVISEAVRELRTDIFFCKAAGEAGERGDDYYSCGKLCKDYLPRNGKNGCCKHRGYCYSPGDEFILGIDGKLNKTK